ncbi:MAG TPA: MFS transporter [Chloroflexota bacterium]|nr:MFS transporter [Chloroflexota bacterium]
MTDVSAIPSSETGRVRPKLWTRGFLLLLTVVFLGYSGQQLILPILPLYVTKLGGTPVEAGFILAAFSITSFPMRPVVGYLTDAWSARGILGIGTLILSLTSFGFFVPHLAVMAVVNAVRGIGWAGLNTGGYTDLAHTAPRARRGEASGYYNLATSIPIAGAPAVALWLLGVPSMGYPSVFLFAALLAAAATLGMWGAQALAPQTQMRSPRDGAVTVSSVIGGFVDRRVFLAAGLLLCMTVTQVSTTAYLPLYARAVGIEGIGSFYVVTGVVGIISQLLCGRFLDRGGRGGWVVAGFATMIVSMLILYAARGLEVVLIAAVINALGSTLLNTMLLVVAMDLADPNRPGAGMATYSVSYQLGAAVGAPVFGMVIQALGFGAMYLSAAGALVVGLIATVLQWPRLRRVGVVAPTGGGNARI